jgi:Protein of unknown function (DUF3105)
LRRVWQVILVLATRKSEKEQRRKARLEAERREASEARRRLIFGYVAAGVLTAVVVVGIVVAVAGGGDEGQDVETGEVPDASHLDLESVQSGAALVPRGVELDGREGTPPPALEQGDLEVAAREAGCEVELDLPDEGNNHLSPNADAPNYKTNPPTSGDHNPVPAADGAYLDPLPPINFVHSMEHGRVLILYDPGLPEEDQLALKGVLDEDPAGMLMFPYPDMPYEVAVTAWTNMVTCDRYSVGVLDVIRDFRDMTRGNGPEPVPL